MTPLDRIGARGAEVEVTATEAELLAIAGRLAIPGVTALSCRYALVRRTDDPALVEATGDLLASVVQVCVVTLEPFETPLRERFRLRFVPAGRPLSDADPDSDDEITYSGVAIDLGEATVEQLALSLDPFPRRPDAVLPDFGEDEPQGGFAALAALRRLT